MHNCILQAVDSTELRSSKHFQYMMLASHATAENSPSGLGFGFLVYPYTRIAECTENDKNF